MPLGGDKLRQCLFVGGGGRGDDILWVGVGWAVVSVPYVVKFLWLCTNIFIVSSMILLQNNCNLDPFPIICNKFKNIKVSGMSVNVIKKVNTMALILYQLLEILQSVCCEIYIINCKHMVAVHNLCLVYSWFFFLAMCVIIFCHAKFLPSWQIPIKPIKCHALRMIFQHQTTKIDCLFACADIKVNHIFQVMGSIFHCNYA